MTPGSSSTPGARAGRRIGETVGGKYVLRDVLGVGGMSTVYAATHRNGLAVAVKILHDELASDQSVRRWFLREAYLANRVNHRGAVRVLDDDVTADGAAYLVLERLYGDTLRAIWERSGKKLPPKEAALFAYDVLDVLSAAHARGIIHRDIKPENLFLTEEGEVKVLDFGIAHPLPVLGEVAALATMRVVGTPAFMAPEQARGIVVRAETDVWGVGATIFALITGGFVHAEAPPPDLLTWAASRAARPIGELARDLPSTLAAVIDQSLAFEPEQRYATAKAMRDALAGAFAATFGESTEDARGEILAGLRVRTPALGSASHEARVHSLATRAPAKDVDASAVTRTARDSETRTADSPALGTPRRVALWLLLATGLLGIAAVLSIVLSRYGLDAHARQRSSTPNTLDTSDTERARATKLFEAGQQAWDDGSLDIARQQFERATLADPRYASAHLGYVLATLWPNDTMRRHFQAAAQNRSDLDERDTSLLDAYEPLARHPASFESAVDRLKGVLSRYPADARVAVAVAAILIKLDRQNEAQALLRTVLQKNPRLAIAWLQLGLSYALAGGVVDARDNFQRCIDLSPSATTCLADLARLDANEGDCEEAEQIARREVSVDSTSVNGYDDLAHALFANGQSLETVSATLEKEWSLVSDNEARDTGLLIAHAQLSVLQGDFRTAREAVQDAIRHVSMQVDESSHAEPAELGIRLDMELGMSQQADAKVSQFLTDQKTWLPDAYSDLTMSIVALRYRLGQMDRSSLSSARTDWLIHQRARERLVARDSLDWLEAYVMPVTTATEAIEAIAALPTGGVPDPLTRDGDVDEEIGRMYFLADKPDEALPFLERSAHSCAAISHPVTTTQAHLLVAELLARIGDRQGSCEAYGVVLRRWGSEPLSRTACRARSESEALHCHYPPNKQH